MALFDFFGTVHRPAIRSPIKAEENQNLLLSTNTWRASVQQGQVHLHPDFNSLTSFLEVHESHSPSQEKVKKIFGGDII